MAVKLSEEEYEHFLHCEVIENNFDFLCDNISPSDHVDFLRSSRIFNQETVEDILSQTTTRQKCRTFLGYLKRRGPVALPLFIQSLMQNRTQLFVAKRLHTSLEELQNNPPPSVLERKPQSEEEYLEFGNRYLAESDDIMSLKECPPIPLDIAIQLPDPPLPENGSYSQNNQTAVWYK